MQKKLNFAIVGCGRVSYKHLNALDELKDHANIVAVCDIDKVKALDKATKYNVPYYTDYHTMLSSHKDIDVVNILTPTGYHAQHVIDIAAYGVNVITEKPMSLSVHDCERMIEACRKAGSKLFVIYQNRYNPPVVAAKKALDQGRFGALFLGTVRVRWRRDQNYYDNDNWHGTWELDGGVMSQQASHHLDLLQYFMGPVQRLQCITNTSVLKIEVEDTSIATITFKSGALGLFEATVATRPKNLEGSLSLLGDKGSLVIGGHAVNKISSWDFENEDENDAKAAEIYSTVVPNVYGLGHTPNIMDIISNIRDGINSSKICDGEQGKKNIEILTALYESAARHGEYLIPGVEIIKSKIGKKYVMDSENALLRQGTL